MDVEIKKINPSLYVNQTQKNLQTPNISQGKAFSDVLTGQIDKSNQLQFSKHANMRLNARDINLTNEQLKRVEDGITQASTKGVRDSLVLVDNVALVVNVRSRTVITAVDKQIDGNIFTNIDGAVIV